jgi:hypothetical protein
MKSRLVVFHAFLVVIVQSTQISWSWGLLVDNICLSYKLVVSLIVLHFFFLIQDEQSIDEVVISMEGGPYQEYFYIELPMCAGSSGSGAMNAAGNNGADTLNLQSGPRHRRFVYVQEESARKFPMQFGLEVCDLHSFISTKLKK